MQKVGVVGPKQSVERIIHFSEELDTELQFIAFPYNIIEETKSIVETHDAEIDYWLFSGITPYTIALETKATQDKFNYIFRATSEIFEGILTYSLENHSIPSAVSMDLMKMKGQDHIDFIVSNQYPMLKQHYFRYDSTSTIEEIFEFHYSLWKNNEVDIVITSYPEVADQLMREGVPVYWTGPSKWNTFYAIQIILEKIKTRYYKDTQTTSVKIKIQNFEKLKISKHSGYSFEFLLLELKKLVLQCCQTLDGLLTDDNNGQFTIFTTRGIAEKHLSKIQETLQHLSFKTESPILVGIGHANTTYRADLFAASAAQQLENQNQSSIVVMDDEGQILEFTEANGMIEYQTMINDAEILKRLQQTSISSKTFMKIASVVKQMHNNLFSSKDLALALQSSERNAQRIIAELVKINLVQLVGEQQRNSRGRATKIYKLITHIES
ncbi:hypothetical protein [Bacillus ndiopicus]|uniref:hypothetical protein n=1 Tax=Bacillus ndiopicus TaxID=1347368 RepID=UPI0005A7F4F5|nr:hypothetical protein [Bacillus ndiopicus]